MQNKPHFENQYAYSLKYLLENGKESTDRTNTGTLRVDIGAIFVIEPYVTPLLQGKFVSWKSAFTEMLWIMMGRTDIKFLHDNKVSYWDEWVLEDGTVGPIYGEQMRNFDGVDQLLNTIKLLHKSPDSRQGYINLWNPTKLGQSKIPCCHTTYHALIVDGALNLHAGQRSGDSFLGIPYNFMLFFFFKEILAYLLNVEGGHIIHKINDYHLYKNHTEQAKKYIDNYLKNPYNLSIKSNRPKIQLIFPKRPDIDSLDSSGLTAWLNEVFELNMAENAIKVNYKIGENTYGKISAPIAV